MSKNEARRQKQLAKKKAKRDDKRTQMARQTSDNPMIRLAAAESWPIVDALVPEGLWTSGIGQLLITRRLPDGRLAVANFLVDVYCLGVKNAYWNIISEWEFDELRRKLEGLGPLHSATPEQFAKLVLGAVDYAQAIGIAPHPDYGHARLLLAGIDPSKCEDTFTYGRDGKPLFINGPHDSPEKIKVIMHKVQLAGGEHVLVHERSGVIRKLAASFEDENEPQAIGHEHDD
jgi:hypothetical protein